MSGARMHISCVLCLTGAALLGSSCNDATSPDLAEMVVVFNTSGVDVDEDGYILRVDDRPVDLVAPNGERRISGLAPGEHVVRIEGQLPNCTIQGLNPRTVVIARGAPTIVQIAVTCVALVGFVDVSTITTGTAGDDAYFLAIDGQPAQPVTSNGFVPFGPLARGAHTFVLSGIAENCAVAGDASRTIVVVAGARALLRFAVTCTAFATITVSTVSTGADPDPSMYFYLETPGSYYPYYGSLGANASFTLPDLTPGTYIATLYDIAANCEAGPNPLTGMTAAGDTLAIAFQITCTTARRLAYTGNVGSGPNASEIFVVKSNGLDVVRLTNNQAQDILPSWSPDGTRIAFASNRTGNNLDVYAMNADGSNPVRLTTSDSSDSDPSWSPDGSRIAFESRRDGDAEIYVMNADGSNTVRLTTSAGADVEPAWSPDGGRIAFRSARDGNDEIYVMAANGTGATRVTRNGVADGQPAWSPDGGRLAFSRVENSVSNIIIANANGTSEVRLDSLYNESEPSWSPDGRWIAFASDYCYYDDCSRTLHLMRPDRTRRVQVTYASSYSPAWRP